MPRFLEHFMNAVPPSSTQVETTQMSTDAKLKMVKLRNPSPDIAGLRKKLTLNEQNTMYFCLKTSI